MTRSKLLQKVKTSFNYRIYRWISCRAGKNSSVASATPKAIKTGRTAKIKNKKRREKQKTHFHLSVSGNICSVIEIESCLSRSAKISPWRSRQERKSSLSHWAGVNKEGVRAAIGLYFYYIPIDNCSAADYWCSLYELCK